MCVGRCNDKNLDKESMKRKNIISGVEIVRWGEGPVSYLDVASLTNHGSIVYSICIHTCTVW